MEEGRAVWGGRGVGGGGGKREGGREGEGAKILCWLVGWLFKVPATC